MFAAEFLFQLSNQPSLDLLVLPQLGYRYKDDDGFLALHINFLKGQIIKGLIYL